MESSTGKPGRPPLEPRIRELEAEVIKLTDRVIALENRSGVYDAKTIALMLDRISHLERQAGAIPTPLVRPLHSAQNATWKG